MSATVRTLVVVTALLAVTASVSAAQRVVEPRRPKLAASADTNDARAYYAFALEILTSRPEQAADALYWATRLDPMWADAYYARRVALLLEDPDRLVGYSTDDSRALAQVRSIDSLLYRALTLNPFLSRRLDRTILQAEMDDIAQHNGRNTVLLEMIASRLPVATRAWLAYCEGENQEALRLYGQAIDHARENIKLRIDRARVYFTVDLPDSALIDLTAALDASRKAEKKDLVFVYQSRALIEHSIAVVYQRLDKTAEAKAAFGRALQEDLSYYPAHLQLAFMALDAKDTTTALAELDLATQLRDDDAGAQYLHAYALVMAGHIPDAEPHIKKALALDPAYAAPKFLYARLLELASFNEEAVAQYKAFLAAAARNDVRRPDAEGRLAALTKPPHGGSR